MTTVVENQARPYGGMPFDHVYHHNLPHHTGPSFTDPWTTAHTSPHANPPVYAGSVGPSPIKEEVDSRPGAMSMPYPGISVSAAPPLNYSSNGATGGYESSTEMMLPRTSFDQAPSYTTAPPMPPPSSASYPSLSSYPLHPQQQGNRRSSNSYFPFLHFSFDFFFFFFFFYLYYYYYYFFSTYQIRIIEIPALMLSHPRQPLVMRSTRVAAWWR